MIIPDEEASGDDASQESQQRGTVVTLIANMGAAPGLRNAALRMNKCLNEHIQTTRCKL